MAYLVSWNLNGMKLKAKPVFLTGVSTLPTQQKHFLIRIVTSVQTWDEATAKQDSTCMVVLSQEFLFWFTHNEVMRRALFLPEKPIAEKSHCMKTTRIKIDPTTKSLQGIGRINKAKVDATTEAQIADHATQDEALAMQDAAKYARRVRRRLGFSQTEFAIRIDVSLETIRNWEQGKRSPTGAAKALLKILDKAPEAALAALNWK